MEELNQLSLALTILLQEALPRLQGPMSIITMLGDEPFFLIIVPIVYWCVDKRLGRQLGYIFLLSAFVNNSVKNFLRQPRPFWLEPSVQLSEAEGYGLPSGHVQNPTAVFVLLAFWLRRSWVWLLVILYITLLGFSRLYLGVHFLQDLIAGLLLGLVVLGIILAWQHYFAASFNRQILGRRLFVLVSVPVVLAAIYVGVMLLLGPPNTDVPWASFIPAAEISTREDVTSSAAGLLGFGIGIVLESSRIRFRSDGALWRRIIRYLLGILVAIGIWAGLREVFPAEPEWIALPLRFLRYLLLLLWVTYFAPWFFVKLRLAATDPESEFKVTFGR
jgi:membrane-associated phospholipid phosphatase